MPGTEVVVDLADTLFAAIERGAEAAVEQIFDDAVAVWWAEADREDEKTRSLRVIRWFIDITAERRYEILDR